MHGVFKDLKFTKAGGDIRERAEIRLARVLERMEKRTEEIRTLATENGLTDVVEVLTNIDDLLNQQHSGAVAASAVKVELQNAIRKLQKERQETGRLKLIIEHLGADDVELDFDAVEYFWGEGTYSEY